jgi:hypothetical protein
MTKKIMDLLVYTKEEYMKELDKRDKNHESQYELVGLKDPSRYKAPAGCDTEW